MTLLELFRFLVPLFAAVSDEDVQTALDLAAAYRPACLTTAQQDEAQVWYAAFILYSRAVQTAGAAGGSGGIVPANIQSEKEGDLSRTYRSGGGSSGEGDPYGFFARWKALAAICAGGAITVGHGNHGPCCC